MPPGDQTISAGGALGQRSTVPKQLVCLVSLSELKINFISERTGTGGGREEGGEWRETTGGISQARFVLPSPSVPLIYLAA